jgi:mono/diheme cytochrome c family protein
MRGGLAAMAVLGLGLAVASGCGDRGRPLLQEHPGYATYSRLCKRCHGNEGNGERASRMAGRPVDLGAPAYADTVDLESVGRIVARGQRRMKGYEDTLDPGEITAVARYVLDMGAARAARNRKETP